MRDHKIANENIKPNKICKEIIIITWFCDKDLSSWICLVKPMIPSKMINSLNKPDDFIKMLNSLNKTDDFIRMINSLSKTYDFIEMIHSLSKIKYFINNDKFA